MPGGERERGGILNPQMKKKLQDNCPGSSKTQKDK